MKHLAIFAMLGALAPWAIAQRGAGARAGFHGKEIHASRRGATSIRGGFGPGRFARRDRAYDYLSLPFPFFDDAYDAGDIYSTGYPVAAPLPEYSPSRVQNYLSRDLESESGSRTEPAAPVMIELQNGRYVQVSTVAIDGEAEPLNGSATHALQGGTGSVAEQTSYRSDSTADKSPAPVLLIFKDGHREEVRDYTIANGVLYAEGDFYVDGYWNKQIGLAALDLHETVQVNAARNVSFCLPSSPNEVIARF